MESSNTIPNVSISDSAIIAFSQLEGDGKSQLSPKKNRRRTTISPLIPRFVPIYKQWEKHNAMYWTHTEGSYVQDAKDWLSIDEVERSILGGTFAFFASGDTFVRENIEEYSQYIPDDYLEMKLYATDQAAREGTHQVVYDQIINEVPSPEERDMYLNALDNWESIRVMSEWMQVRSRDFDGMEDWEKLRECILINICAECVIFPIMFPVPVYFKTRGKFEGIAFMNEKIMLDETNHGMTFIKFYTIEFMRTGRGHTKEHIAKTFKEAVLLAKAFVDDFVPADYNVKGEFNNSNLKQYAEYICDYYLSFLNIESVYGSENPFIFMNLSSLIGETNFFEKKVGEYNMADTTGWETAKVSASSDF